MTTSSPSPGATNADQDTQHPAFAGLDAGLHFFQDWMKAASGAGLAGASMTGASAGQAGQSWGMPTLDPETLEKRIEELRTVQFWLEQNSRMIAMTIQGLEVQRMTLQTLQDMNVSMDAVRESLRAQAGQAAAPADPDLASPPEPAGPDTGTAINPLRWWGALTDQFQTLAQQAVQQVASTAQAATEAAAAGTSATTQATAQPKRRAAPAGHGTKRKPAASGPAPDKPARAPRARRG